MKKTIINPDSNETREGYTNVVATPVKPKKGANIIPGVEKNIPVDEAQDKIVINQVLNRLNPNDIIELLKGLVEKLTDTGSIHVTFIDIRGVATSIVNGSISLQDIHAFLLGGQNEYKSVLDIPTMKLVAEELKLKIKNISVANHVVSMEITK